MNDFLSTPTMVRIETPLAGSDTFAAVERIADAAVEAVVPVRSHNNPTNEVASTLQSVFCRIADAATELKIDTAGNPLAPEGTDENHGWLSSFALDLTMRPDVAHAAASVFYAAADATGGMHLRNTLTRIAECLELAGWQ